MLLLYTTHVMHFANTLEDTHKLLSLVENFCMQVNEVLTSPSWNLCLWIRLKPNMENETIIYMYVCIYLRKPWWSIDVMQRQQNFGRRALLGPYGYVQTQEVIRNIVVSQEGEE